MAKITYKAQSASKIVKHLVCAAALAVGGVAQAGVLNFNGSDPNLLFDGSYVETGEYWYQTGSGSAGGVAGAIIDGSDAGTCTAPITCPVNNTSQYLGLFDDGYMYFGLQSGATFHMGSLKASVLGAGQALASTAAVILLQGFDAAGNEVGGPFQLNLAGPRNGVLNFATFNLGGIPYEYSYVLLYAYACDATGSCTRGGGLANFALDDIVTVPEPASMALFGLGLAGLGVFRRRRAA